MNPCVVTLEMIWMNSKLRKPITQTVLGSNREVNFDQFQTKSLLLFYKVIH